MPEVRPLLVGEDNPYGSDPHYALYPLPEGSAGGRLCRKVMGLTAGQYLRRFDRVNLCARRWTIREARESVRSILAVDRPAVVLLGARVCDAFGRDYAPFTSEVVGSGILGQPHWRIVVLPHPSGRSRAWNEAGAYERAREALCKARVLRVSPPTAEEWLADLPPASYTSARPARCENCGGLVEGRDCPECGAP